MPKRYVDADEAKRCFLDCAASQLRLDHIEDARAFKHAADYLDGIPTADVEPIRHAHWIVEYNPVSHNPMRFVCSCCGEHWTPIDGVVWLRFLGRCPNSICGAILDEDEEVKQ